MSDAWTGWTELGIFIAGCLTTATMTYIAFYYSTKYRILELTNATKENAEHIKEVESAHDARFLAIQHTLEQGQRDGESRNTSVIQQLTNTVQSLAAKSNENSEMILKMETVMTRTYMPADQVRQLFDSGRKETREDLSDIKMAIRDMVVKVDMLSRQPISGPQYMMVAPAPAPSPTPTGGGCPPTSKPS